MRLIALSVIREFWENPQHYNAEQSLKAWVDEVRTANWQNPADIKEKYRNASILKNRRVVFNIKGNEYRIVVAIAYQLGIVYVKFIGTHQQYDAIDANTIELES
ncbi:type II toxin-antitoxin system HigB family toxin [Rouxiella sp. Mn2063]|uniref:type II toxin-antitoxin system HigB family toxin n=1 Tax=Rouxiella sp. Mn2063 TaxID=3395262 RepID=UPI003BEBFA57